MTLNYRMINMHFNVGFGDRKHWIKTGRKFLPVFLGNGRKFQNLQESISSMQDSASHCLTMKANLFPNALACILLAASTVFLFSIGHSEDCLTPVISDITCSCTNSSISCNGTQNNGTAHFFVVAINLNISSILFFRDPNFVEIDIISSNSHSNGTVEMLSSNSLKLGSELYVLQDTIFMGITESLVYLSLINNTFENVPANALKVLSELELLDLSYNKISNLSKDDFEGLINLKTLYLGHNNIETLPDEAFMIIGSLTTLYLDSNNIKTIASHAFDGLPNLKTVYLAKNRIESIHLPSIVKLENLNKLVVDHNNLSSIFHTSMESLSLIHLSAVNCSIEGALDQDSFQYFKSLEYLDLSFNLLSEVHSFALFELHQLRTLNLSYNDIEALRTSAFTSNWNLEYLYLQNNELSVIEFKAFSDLTNLKVLDLNNNKLSAFLCDYTGDLISLEMMKLENNSLKTISSGTFKYSKHLKVLNLMGNTLDCSCSLSAFVKHLQSDITLTKADFDSVLCASPKDQQGKSIIDIDFEPMKCHVSVPCKSSTIPDYNYNEEDDVVSVIHNSKDANPSWLNFEMATTTALMTSFEKETISLSATEFSSSSTQSLEPQVKITKFVPTQNQLCLEWIIHGPIELDKSVHCLLYFEIGDNKHVKNLACPTSSGMMQKQCVQTADTVDAFCVRIESDISVASSCNLPTSTTQSFPLTQETTKKFQKPLNFTYFNITHLNLTSARIEWLLSRRAPSNVCHLKLRVFSDTSNVTTKIFICTDNTFVVDNLNYEEWYKVCLIIHHHSFEAYEICQFSHRAQFHSFETDASHINVTMYSSSSLPVAVLVVLLLFVIGISALLVLRAIHHKQSRNRYNMSKDDSIVRAKSKTRNPEHTVRYSCTLNEDFHI